MEATITLDYPDEKTAEAVTDAVSPDNFKTPIGLEVRTMRENNKVVSKFRFEGKLVTFTATVDDLLFSASIAEKTLNALRKMK